ncbi:type IV pilus biogenesis/stability protein PilW [Leptothrix discophora]|uniref:Type IV pilus biogenesis/stability protein PilW n=1 Tax=Leptothrix discophora TaxID=89 RepID=A0ABT9G0W9_LEPDI|nr:type IV pilus biogenesis/stability protein PilW [Leptothrix discophora]MDP4300134.1 type IV pilus biogenesis/stability protein PilW [Leptothrix discophora]
MPKRLLRVCLAAAVVAGFLVGLPGCTTTTEVVNTSVGDTRQATPPAGTNSAPSTTQAGAPRPDLVTASDETDVAKRSRIRLELAAAYFSQGQAGTALDEVKRALQADSNNGAAYNLRGLIYASLSEDALADESFRRALAINAADADASHNYAWYLCQKRRYPEARRYFEQTLALPRYRDPSKTLLAQGVCEARAGDLAASERLLARGFELDTGNPAIAYNLAEVLMRRGDLDRARFYVQRLNGDSNLSSAETLWLAARIEHRRNDLAATEDLGRQLRNRYPGSRESAAFERGLFDE